MVSKHKNLPLRERINVEMEKYYNLMRNLEIFDLCCSVRGGGLAEVREDVASVLERQSLTPHQSLISTPHLNTPHTTPEMS